MILEFISLVIKDKDKHPFVLYAFQRSTILSIFISLYEYGDKKFLLKNKNLRKFMNSSNMFILRIIFYKIHLTDSNGGEEYTWTDNEKFRSLFQKKYAHKFFNNWDFSSTNLFFVSKNISNSKLNFINLNPIFLYLIKKYNHNIKR